MIYIFITWCLYKNYADIDTLSAAFNNMFKAADKDKMNNNMKEGAEATEYTRDLVFNARAQLSLRSGHQK